MSKAIIVVDFAYKGPHRTGRGTGHKGLSSTLKYLQYRDKVQNQLAQNRDYERWQDRRMGVHWRELLENCDAIQSKHVLAWTEELVAGRKIEIENFLVLETKTVDLGTNRGELNNSDSPRQLRKVTLRVSKYLRNQLKS